MKCPFCGQEHPDTAKFCMETGQRLEPQKKACSNKLCPDFGKNILPIVAKFCPRCGAKLDKSDSKLDKSDSKLDKSDSKLDKSDSKLDKSDSKLDKSDSKLDKLDSKLDKLDSKLDKSDVKVDSYKSEKNEALVNKIESVVPIKASMKPNVVLNEKRPNKLSFYINDVVFNMILVEHGTFRMGEPEGQQIKRSFFSKMFAALDDFPDNARPVHKVTLTRDYYIGETTVVQLLWNELMEVNPSDFIHDNNPVEHVKWNDSQVFIKKLNTMLHSQLNGWSFRLPTEAEWEFAARGGSKTRGYRYSGSNNIDDVAWYGGKYKYGPDEVGTKCPNELGLYDMSGNVWEMCEDWYSEYSSVPQTDPKGAKHGDMHVCRGGTYFLGEEGSLPANRLCLGQDTIGMVGLRLVLSEN